MSRNLGRERIKQKKKEKKEQSLIVKHVKDKLDEAIAEFDNSREGFEEYDEIVASFKELDTLGASSKFDSTPESDLITS